MEVRSDAFNIIRSLWLSFEALNIEDLKRKESEVEDMLIRTNLTYTGIVK